MKVQVHTLHGEKRGEIALGKAFSTPIREDIIRRAFLAESSLKRQIRGADPLAGKRTSAHYHGLRGYRWSMMNREMARMKRIHGQGFLNYTARFVPQATKGRKAHPPKTEKNWEKKINNKERIYALLSAISASAKGMVVVEDNFQELKKTKEVAAALEKLGIIFKEKKTIRSGKGTRRGRKYKRSRGPLIIVAKDNKVPSPPGFDVKILKDLQVSDLAPGGNLGRVCIWTRSAAEEAGKL
ncbi:MAG: 50S ribosomal protein L4 [Candidatus Aenigmarchaeota archaeon]|nr:50S ribosomal protein L4 [Candidatus Aenigmarchaeota archaeon]